MYNRFDLLQTALSSVINQTYKNIEIIIIDDGSEKNIFTTVDLSDKRIRYIKTENKGVACARNLGIDLAKGEYIAFLDSDDFWGKNKLEKQVSTMIKHSYVCTCHCYYYFDDEKGKVVKKINTNYKGDLNKIQFRSYRVQTSCFMLKLDAIRNKKIYFDESKTFGEDNEFYLQITKYYSIENIDEYLGYFRIKKSNAGKDIRKQIMSRSNIWTEYRRDEFFKKNTSLLCRIAYRYCFSISKMTTVMPISVLKMLYIIPWGIFKLETAYLNKIK